VIEPASSAFELTINSGFASDGRIAMPTKSKSSIITRRYDRYEREMPPIHPGEILREEFLVPLGLSANALAIAIGVPATRVNEIVNERRGISGDTALRLGRYFHMTGEFWMGLQGDYELELVRYRSGKEIKLAVRPAARDKKTGALKLAAA
jgi:addiction module HigA family antidote